MDLTLIWFVLVFVLLIGYAILDGFDLGVGVLHLFARKEQDRLTGLQAVAPVWDGNEVWLLTGGGALFAAFPRAYATVFSGFYLALVLLLVALIFRAVSIEFRGKVASAGWRRAWDIGFGLGSLVPALLLGVALGNVMRGIPLDAQCRFTGTFLGLLNPYALVCGVFSLVTLTLHGALYLAAKAEEDYARRMAGVARRLWIAFVVLLLAVFTATAFAAPHIFASGLPRPVFWVAIVVLLAGTLGIPVGLGRGCATSALVASSAAIGALLAAGATGMYPRIVPSLTDLANNSLTVTNAASTPATQAVMLAIALIGMPIVLAYTVFVYRVFKGRTRPGDIGY